MQGSGPLGFLASCCSAFALLMWFPQVVGYRLTPWPSSSVVWWALFCRLLISVLVVCWHLECFSFQAGQGRGQHLYLQGAESTGCITMFHLGCGGTLQLPGGVWSAGPLLGGSSLLVQRLGRPAVGSVVFYGAGHLCDWPPSCLASALHSSGWLGGCLGLPPCSRVGLVDRRRLSLGLP